MRACVVLCLVLLAVGCGEKSGVDDPVVEADTAPDTITEPDEITGPEPCPNGQLRDEDGLCAAAGVQECAALFTDPDDGLCKPSTALCAPGEIPIFDTGCSAVGIPDCLPMFMDEESGLCKPSIDHCAPGEIPIFDEGCRAVGVSGCHASFVDPETGLCIPNPDDCGPGLAVVPTGGCRSLDPAAGCGEGTWGEVEALDGDVHVDPSYGGGDSDGSRDKPWTLTGYALGDVQAGGRIILAAGEYDSGIILTKSVGLVGRCASMVSLTGVRSGDYGATVLEAKGAVEVTISDVRVSGAGFGVIIHGGATANLSRVRIEGNQGLGLLASDEGTTATVTDVLIEATGAMNDGSFGMGAQVSSGATMNLSGGAIIGNRQTGLVATDPGTVAHVEDVLVARTTSLSNGLNGEGVQVNGGAQLTLTDVVISENRDEGLLLGDVGTLVTASRVVVAHTQPASAVTSGIGASVNLGSSLSMEDSAVLGNRNVGLYVIDAGSTATVSSSLFARQEPASDGTGGVGLHVEAGGAVTGHDVTVAENVEFGIYARGIGTEVELNDSLVTRTTPSPDGSLGWGIELIDGAAVTLTGSAILENTHAGVVADKPGTIMTLNQSIVANTLKPVAHGSALGIEIIGRAWLNGDQLAVVDNTEVGLVADGEGTRVTLSRTLVSRTQSVAAGFGGRAMQIQEFAEAIVSNSAFSESREFAAIVYSATATFTKVLFEGTRSGVAEGYGDGLTALAGGNVIGTSLVSRDHDRAGLLIHQSNATLSSTAGFQNQFGLVVQGDLNPLIHTDNHFTDNSENTVMGSTLSVPDTSMPLPEPPDP